MSHFQAILSCRFLFVLCCFEEAHPFNHSSCLPHDCFELRVPNNLTAFQTPSGLYSLSSGGGDFFLTCKDFWIMSNHSFPACVF